MMLENSSSAVLQISPACSSEQEAIRLIFAPTVDHGGLKLASMRCKNFQTTIAPKHIVMILFGIVSLPRPPVKQERNRG